MFYRDRIRSLQRSAEANFRNFEGLPASRNFRRADGGSLQASAVGTLDPNDRTWTVVVTNSSSAASYTATVFGAVYDLTDANLNANLSITVSESTHLKVKTELLTRAVRILGLKMTVTAATQFSNVISFYDETSSGALDKRIFSPLTYRAAQNTLTTQIDAPSFELLLKPTTYMQFTVNASEVVTFIFNIVEKVNLAALLSNAPVVSVSNKPAPTGLPQVDMPRGV